jgi:acetoin utilization protein AcuC
MAGRVQIVYGDSYMGYRHSPDHPLQPLRVKLAVELIQSLGLLRGADMVPPRQATVDEIALVHAPDYIELVRRLGGREDGVPVREALEAGFGSGDNPIFERMHEASAEIVGGSLVAAEAVASGGALHAFNPAGGLHHAMRGRASGFCVYNDPAVAIAWLRASGHRVAYVDVDVHHGDGVQALFYSDPEVLTISLHETGRYLFPGTGWPHETGTGAGRGLAANLPLQPFTWDEPWLAAFEAVVPPLLRTFRPSVLVTQDGCDTHLLDPLAHLQTSTRIWPVIGRRFHELAHELCEGRWVATGGGGYAVTEVVPRAWTLLVAEMVERPQLAVELLDPEAFLPEPEAQERVWRYLEKDLDQLSRDLKTELQIPSEAR